MIAKYGYLLKVIPAWVPLTLLSVAFLLTTIIPKFFSPYFISDSQLAYLSIDGDVKVSDGISDISARDGALIARSVRTLLKTGKGNASLKLRDGSFVILDSKSTIEFNRPTAKDPGRSFAFNLVSGRVLVINGQDSRTPTQVFVGGSITARIFQAAMGLEVQADNQTHERVDCLVGPCLVNGAFQLVSGQSVAIGPGGNVQVVKGIPYDAWISLGKVGVYNPVLSNLFAGIHPTATPAILALASPNQVTRMFPDTSGGSMTPSPSDTVTVQPTPSVTPTPTSTNTHIPWVPPSPTPQPVRVASSTPTPMPSRTSTPTETQFPTGIPTPTLTLEPTLTLGPSDTPTPEPTSTPTSEPTNTLTPEPTRTRRPTRTEEPTATWEPTKTEEPSATSVPTDTPVPTVEPSSTEAIVPTVETTPANIPAPPSTR